MQGARPNRRLCRLDSSTLLLKSLISQRFHMQLQRAIFVGFLVLFLRSTFHRQDRIRIFSCILLIDVWKSLDRRMLVRYCKCVQTIRSAITCLELPFLILLDNIHRNSPHQVLE